MFSMNKLNYLFYPFLLLLISLIIFVKDKSDQRNGVYDNLHDQIKYKIIYNNQNTLNEKISFQKKRLICMYFFYENSIP